MPTATSLRELDQLQAAKELAARRLYRSQPEYKVKHAAYNKQWYQEHKERVKKQNRKAMLKCLYNLTEEDVQEALKAQNNKCAICLKEKYLVIDHDHKTGLFRGMLCRACNVAIGQLGDCQDGVFRAIKYLERQLSKDVPKVVTFGQIQTPSPVVPKV